MRYFQGEVHVHAPFGTNLQETDWFRLFFSLLKGECQEKGRRSGIFSSSKSSFVTPLIAAILAVVGARFRSSGSGEVKGEVEA